MIAARLANMRQGARTDLSPIGGMSQPQAAQMLNVSPKSVERAKAVQTRGIPELQKAVEQGEVAVSAAAKVAALPADEQRKILSPAAQGGRARPWGKHGVAAG